jgi:uncharacterized protein
MGFAAQADRAGAGLRLAGNGTVARADNRRGRRRHGSAQGPRATPAAAVPNSGTDATLGSVTFLDLRSVRLRSGEELRVEREVEIAPIELGGERYVAVPEKVPAEVVVTRATTGTVFELGFRVRLHGPCYRCLGDAVVDESLHIREYQAESPDGVEELTTPYVADDRLDLSAWARDALVLALPDKILCREACAGLCAVCGRDLNREPHAHEDDASDPRWAALANLRDRL